MIVNGTYEMIEKIGDGGGGVVYLANHMRLGKKVVLKADKRKITANPEFLRREVDVLKDLSHPHIPQVYDFFVENETVYTAMDYIAGESLDKPLKRGEKYPQAQVIQWAIQILEALCYLHSPTHGTPPRGYVHSDIKPANLMRTPENEVFLIDFNIALALGEENVIGCSAGYASPEHYGIDFSSDNGTSAWGRSGMLRSNAAKNSMPDIADEEVTVTRTVSSEQGEATEVTTGDASGSGAAKFKIVVPDIRSDIYSLGATLYHLLSGKRPARNAKEVIPLSKQEFSTQVVKIITKAMNPNPDLRYQTAEEMLDEFLHLHENDPRLRRRKRKRRISCVLFGAFFVAGVVLSFVGLKRMQTAESWLKLAEYSQNFLARGDTEAAITYALQAMPQQKNILTPAPAAEPQRALTKALGVYDLSDGYKSHGAVELPAAPLCMEISPDGRTACCIYAYSAVLFDTGTMEQIVELPTIESALSEVKFLNNSTILYAGSEGIEAYDFEKGAALWNGNPATSISISGDGKRAAAVYKEEESAAIYDTSNGQILYTVDFEGRHQSVAVNDRFANPNDNLFALNYDGTKLGASFSDGSLQIFNVSDPERNLQLLDETSGYAHFEGGFYQKYFAFSASSLTESVFAVIDTEKESQTGGFETEGYFGVQADESGICLQSDNILVKIHPETGEQTPLVTTSENLHSFSRSNLHTLVTTDDRFLFFDRNAQLISAYDKEHDSDFVQIAEGTALVGSSDSSLVRILKYENHPDTELFAYDASYEHDEARVSADGRSLMLFSYQEFRIYDTDGRMKAEVQIPDEKQVYDQQYIREGEDSYLEVIYYDGTVLTYDAKSGVLLSEQKDEKPDPTLYEEFNTEKLRIESPLHGTPMAYDRKTGRFIRELDRDAYLTYVTQAGDYVVVQYITADGYCYGQLLNEQGEVLAELPYLCDVTGETLIFDYPTGDIRESCIYDVEEMIVMAEEKLTRRTFL